MYQIKRFYNVFVDKMWIGHEEMGDLSHGWHTKCINFAPDTEEGI